MLRILQAAPLELYTCAAVVLHYRAMVSTERLDALDAIAMVGAMLWLCDQLYSMLLRWLELLAMAVRSALLDATAMAGAIGISCALRCIRCCCDGRSYRYWLCDQMYSMLLRWLWLSVLAVRSYVFDAIEMAVAIGID